MATVNRGWLKKQVQLGKVQAKCNYHLTDDYARDNANNFSTMTHFIPCRMRDGGSFVEGFINFTDWDFKTKSGGAYKNSDGTIGFYIHSNLSYDLKVTA